MSRVPNEARRTRHQRESRLEQGLELRALYRELGHDRRGAAKFLRVTSRTLLNWESGATPIPFAALKLLRLLVRSELPGREWQGWCFNRGTLWSPEGHGFKPQDFAWLSLTIRQARMFAVLYRERTSLRRELEAAKVEAARARLSAEADHGLLQLAACGALPDEPVACTKVDPARPTSARAGRGGAAPERADHGSVLVTRSGILTGEKTRRHAGGAA